MSDLETRNPISSGNDDLRHECASLQRQITTLLVAVFVLSGTVTVFLWRQASYARTDLELLKPPAMQIIQAFKQEKPIMDDFVAKLAEFSKRHPDFAPILSKYQPVAAIGITSAPPAVVAPKTTPASVPATIPKK